MHIAIALLAALFTASPSLAQTVTQVLAPAALSSPTSMAFVGPGDFLVLEKNTGRGWIPSSREQRGVRIACPM